MALSRIKSIAGSKRLSKEPDSQKLFEINLKSPFLKLPAEIRNKIYGYAFTRTNIEHLQSLQLGPQANDACGLIFTCRQIRDEAREFYQADSVTCMWSWFAQDSLPFDNVIYKSPVIQNWQKSRHGLALKHRPQTIKSLAWQISLARNSRSVCDHFLDAEVFKTGLVQPEDLYIRICICDALSWLHDAPSHTMTLCIALESIAMQFPSLERIHVYYCGRTWPEWIGNSGDINFADIVFGRHQFRMYSGSNWSVKKVPPEYLLDDESGELVRRVEGDSEQWVVRDEGGDERPCGLRTEMTWNETQAHPGSTVHVVPWRQRTLRIDYYDSWNLCEERCVRNKPRLGTRPKKPAPRPSSMSRGVSKVKSMFDSFRMEAPLGGLVGNIVRVAATK